MRETEGSDSEGGRGPDPFGQIKAELARLNERAEERDALLARIAELERRHRATTANYDRLKNRKAVRLALAVADAGSTRLRSLRRLGRPERRLRRPYRTQAELTHTLRSLRPDPGRTEGPLVSIIVPTRNGAAHLRRLLAGLERHTAYRDFELIVIDNGSTDETPAVLRSARSHPVTVLRSAENQTFSASCNQGAARAGGDLLLFLNNDTEPVNDGWLGALVDALVDEDHPKRVGCGALLVHPQGRHTRAKGQAPLTVQHRGIAFSWVDGGPRPVNLGLGDEPDREELAITRPVAAATAACLMVRRAAFEAVGGFTERYVYGWEDVDLCMKLRHEGGEIAVCGGSVLYHHEFGTQEALGAERRRVNYLNNSRTFRERWTPQLRRLMERDRLEHGGMWTTDPGKRLAITVSDLDEAAGFGDWYTAHELGDAFAAHGWSVRYIQRKNDDWHKGVDADLVIALLPQFDPRTITNGAITVAWVRNWVERWVEADGFAAYHTVVASTEDFADRIRTTSLHDPAVIPLATNPERFRRTERDLALACDFTFTGSAWGAPRDLIDTIDVRPDEDFKLFGKGWDRYGAGTRYWRGHLDYARLPALYSSTQLVLDDTVEPNRPAVNSRVFDALATGTLVLSDNQAGSEEWFDGLLPTYSNRAELRALLNRYLGDEDARAALAGRLRDLVLERHTYEQRVNQFLAAVERNVEAPAIGLRIAPPTWKEAPRWGDTHFATDLAGALRARGLRTSIAVRSEWDEHAHQGVDIALHLRGIHPYPVKPGHINMLWIISHPDDVTGDECDRYDVVAAAGTPLAARLSEETGSEVAVLLQATNPARFAPGPPDPDLTTDVLFVGNSRGHDRPIVDWALAAGLDVTIYGMGWDGTPAAPHVRAEHLSNAEVPAAYRSARVVLNDHWPDMAAGGIVSNRIFDAVASGAVVVTDMVAGLGDVIGDAVAIATSAETLRDAVGAIKRERSAFESRAAIGAKLVREEHTFAARAEQIITLLRPLFEDWGGIPGGAPEWWRLDETTRD